MCPRCQMLALNLRSPSPHCIADVPSLLFRLHTLCQPGGISERAAVLKHLEGKPGGEDVHECVAALRKWRRYLERAEAMNASVPDPSILLAGVELIAKKAMASHPEVKFRTDLMKNALQLQGRPTQEGVLRLHTHILAELQMIAPVSLSSTSSTALKALGTGQAGTGEASSPTSSPSRKSTGKLPCKFFLSKTGCAKGSVCKFDHTFESKEEKRTRCWECGSQLHRRGECPVAAKLGKGQKSPGKGDKQIPELELHPLLQYRPLRLRACNRSYGACVVTLHGTPIAWKSGRQGMVTLSTMESELLEATNAATLLECVGCLVDELYQKRVPRHLRVDNSSATAVWRSWILENETFASSLCVCS